VLRARLLISGILLALATTWPVAAEWPQWGGPTRDYKVEGRDLAADWPESGPKVLWRRTLGDGNACIVHADGLLISMYRSGREAEKVVALNAASGETVWEYEQPARVWRAFVSGYGPGPHSTPVLFEGRVYAVGVRGDLVCLDLKTGEKIWGRSLWDDFLSTPPERGYASSPLVYDNKLILAAGGAGHGAIALDLADGHLIWASGDSKGTYASPIVINVDGQDQVVFFFGKGLAGFDPATGKLLWDHPHRTRYNINASTPVWGEANLLVVSAAYDSGARALQLIQKDGTTTVRERWTNRKFQVHHTNAIRRGDLVYGSHGDFGPALLATVRAETGEILSRQRGFAKANLVAVGDRIILLDEEGVLGLGEFSGDSIRILAKAQVVDNRAWSAPTLVGTKVYLRAREEFVAVEMGVGRQEETVR